MKKDKKSVGKDEIIKGLQEKVSKGVEEVINSDSWRSYLTTMSKFHRYSASNSFIIFFDCMLKGFRPSYVAGFNTWKSFNRTVKTGETAIKILAPLIKKQKNKQENKLEENDESYLYGFKYVNVFDIAQTEVISDLEDGFKTICNELKGNSENAQKLICSIKDICPIKIIEEDIQSGAKGYYNSSKNLIAIKTGVSPIQYAKTLVHEYSHYLMTNKGFREKINNDRALEEVIVESVAFVVNSYHGIDTSEYSFEYVTSWSNGEADKVKQVADIIQKLSKLIIGQVETLLEIQAA